LQGRRTDSLPDGSPQEEGDPDQEGEAGQVLGGAELYAEAAALGIPESLLQTHAPVIQGHQVREGVGQIGRQPPGFFLPWGPDPEDLDSDGLVLPEVDHLPGVEEPATQRTTNDGFSSSRSCNPETR
jgi:hypothetical protein